jgi:hypothetical protein
MFLYFDSLLEAPESQALPMSQSRDGVHKNPSCEIPDITPGNVPNGHIRQAAGDDGRWI